jgi:hypothetical protein
LVMTAGAAPATSEEPAAQSHVFVRSGSWWGLDFAKDNHPPEFKRDLGRVPLVKVVAVDNLHPSWIKITYPKDKDEHFKLAWKLGQAIENSPDALPKATLAILEAEVKNWDALWVNLQFVVSAIEAK